MKRFIAGMIAVALPAILLAADAVTKTVQQLHAERQALNGKLVTISGEVTRVTNNVMQRNFLHLKDGTGKEDSNDVTVTSTQTAAIGDHITVTGTVAVDRDFGAGYTYPVIVEQATISQSVSQ